MIFLVYSEPVSHFVECFFVCVFRLPLAPVPYLVYSLVKKNCCQVLFCMITMKTFGFYLFEPTFRAIRTRVNWSNTIEILCSKSFSLSFSMLASKLDYSTEKPLQNNWKGDGITRAVSSKLAVRDCSFEIPKSYFRNIVCNNFSLINVLTFYTWKNYYAEKYRYTFQRLPYNSYFFERTLLSVVLASEHLALSIIWNNKLKLWK